MATSRTRKTAPVVEVAEPDTEPAIAEPEAVKLASSDQDLQQAIQEGLKQSVFIAVVAALANKGTPADEAAEVAKQYAIAAVAVYF